MMRDVRFLARLVIPALVAIASAVHAAGADRAIGGPEKLGATAASDRRPVVKGRLKNGVRFAILSRRGHEPGLGLLMRDEGGFIAERRHGERGLAHLIEHVAFLSPTAGSPDDLHHLLHVGRNVTLSARSAGTTSWRETNYFFSTTTTSLADLDTMLGLMREVATGLTFRRDAVDEGRAQVVEEMAGRKPDNDIYAGYIAAVAPGSPNDVIDAQNSDDVPTAGVDTIRSLYRRLYQPANMMIVVVGNVDPARTRDLIRRRFADWQGPRPAHQPVPTIRTDRIAPVSSSSSPQGRRTAMVTIGMPMARPVRSRRRQATALLMDMLATRAVANRLARARSDSAPGETGTFIENGEPGYRQIMLWDNFAAGQWQPAVTALWRTTCDLHTTGFTETEWDAARGDVLGDLSRRTEQENAATNVELAKDLSHALAVGRDLIPPDRLLRYARTFLPAVDARTATNWFQRQWRAGTAHLRVEGPELVAITEPIPAIRRIADQAVEPPTCKLRE